MPYYNSVSSYYTPTSGGTINLPAFDHEILCAFVDNTTTLTSLNIVFPPSAVDGQAIRVFFKNAITVLNLTVGVGTILGAVTALLGTPSSIAYAYCATTNSWWKG